MNRRQDVIDAAAGLLREGGPDALTTVAVAGRLGVTQSALYRHVRNLEELATVASRQVVAAMQERLRTTIIAADVAWDRSDIVRRCSALMVTLMKTDRTSFEIVERWRFADGALGAGIRDLLHEGSEFGSTILESEWRNRYGYTKRLTPTLRRIQQTHSALIQDDAIRISSLAGDGTFPGGDRSIARMLELRMLAGYLAYTSDMNRRLGLPAVIN